MELGMLMVPLHRPERPFLTVLREDREAIVLADEAVPNLRRSRP